MDAFKLISRAGMLATAFAAVAAFSQPASAVTTTLDLLGSVSNQPPGPDSFTYTDDTLRATLMCSLGCEGLLSSLVSGVYPDATLPPASSAAGFGNQADLFDLGSSSDATELAFVNANVDPDFASGTKGANNAGEFLIFTSTAEYLLFKIGTDPNYALIKNLFPGQEFKYQAESGEGAGISHITSYGGSTTVIPLPASLPLLFGALAGLGFITRRRRAA